MNIFKSLFSHKHEAPATTEDLVASMLNTTQQMLDSSQR